MTPYLVTEPEQLTDLDFYPPEKPVVFWVSDGLSPRSSLFKKFTSKPFQVLWILPDQAGLAQCAARRAHLLPSVILIDATANLQHAMNWCSQLMRMIDQERPFILLGVETEQQGSELLAQGLPVGIQDIVTLSSEAWISHRLAIALQLSAYRSENVQLSQEVQNLERLNNLKDEFISTVVHELRTPITNMKIAGQLVEAQIQRVQQALGEEIQSDTFGKALIYLQTLKQECERETLLINNLLDLQSLESGDYALDRHPIEVRSWLTELLAPFHHRAESRQIKFETDISTALPPLVSSAMSLERVLNELLHNACKYTPPGETIHLFARISTPDMLELTVKNTGVEIPEEAQVQVFEKFYRVPRSDRWKQGGTGLGLTLVKQLMTRLGGSIELKSGSGDTQFILQLPLRDPLV